MPHEMNKEEGFDDGCFGGTIFVPVSTTTDSGHVDIFTSAMAAMDGCKTG